MNVYLHDLKMSCKTEVDKVTEDLYNAYGSGTGVLFGIPEELRPSVRAIIKLVLENEKKKIKKVIDKVCINEWENCGGRLKHEMGID